MIQESKSRLLSRQEVEAIYGVSKRFLEKAAADRKGPIIVRIGRLVRYRVKDIEAWIASQANEEGL